MANWEGEDEMLLNLLPIDSSSSFGAVSSLPGGPPRVTSSMAFGDLNQDGFIDIVVGYNGQSQMLLNKEDGSFDAIDLPTSLSSSDMPTSQNTCAVAVGDIVDNDEWPDIVVCCDYGCEILGNNGNLTFNPIPLSNWTSSAIGIGDVNNDTFMDVIIGGYDGDVLFINNNDGTFIPINLPGHNETNGRTGTSSIALADFNGDNW
jgi:hypothetical protein